MFLCQELLVFGMAAFRMMRSRRMGSLLGGLVFKARASKHLKPLCWQQALVP